MQETLKKMMECITNLTEKVDRLEKEQMSIEDSLLAT
jgi:exonuclease VII small subunit